MGECRCAPNEVGGGHNTSTLSVLYLQHKHSMLMTKRCPLDKLSGRVQCEQLSRKTICA